MEYECGENGKCMWRWRALHLSYKSDQTSATAQLWSIKRFTALVYQRKRLNFEFFGSCVKTQSWALIERWKMKKNEHTRRCFAVVCQQICSQSLRWWLSNISRAGTKKTSRNHKLQKIRHGKQIKGVNHKHCDFIDQPIWRKKHGFKNGVFTTSQCSISRESLWRQLL